MDYLTKYYKNLSEQLQEQINILEAQLNEINMSDPRNWWKPTPINWMKDALSGDGTDKGQRIPYGKPYGDERNPNNPDGPPIGREGEEGYWELDQKLVGRNYKPRDRWIPGKRPREINKMTGKESESIFDIYKKYSQTSAQTSGETDEDIYRMRQTAADQGGIPQSMVNEPINRPKQMPKTSNNPYYDGRLDSDGNFVPKPPPSGKTYEDGYWEKPPPPPGLNYTDRLKHNLNAKPVWVPGKKPKTNYTEDPPRLIGGI